MAVLATQAEEVQATRVSGVGTPAVQSRRAREIRWGPCVQGFCAARPAVRYGASSSGTACNSVSKDLPPEVT